MFIEFQVWFCSGDFYKLSSHQQFCFRGGLMARILVVVASSSSLQSPLIRQCPQLLSLPFICYFLGGSLLIFPLDVSLLLWLTLEFPCMRFGCKWGVQGLGLTIFPSSCLFVLATTRLSVISPMSSPLTYVTLGFVGHFAQFSFAGLLWA